VQDDVELQRRRDWVEAARREVAGDRLRPGVRPDDAVFAHLGEDELRRPGRREEDSHVVVGSEAGEAFEFRTAERHPDESWGRPLDCVHSQAADRQLMSDERRDRLRMGVHALTGPVGVAG